MSAPDNWLSRFVKSGDGGAGPPKVLSKKMWWLAGAVLLGISLIFLGSGGNQPSPPAGENLPGAGEEAADRTPRKTLMAAEEEALAVKLQTMLEKIEGAGNVKVTVRLATSARESYATNSTTGRKTTVEKDQGGGARTINENTDTTQLVIARDGKGDAPVVEMESASRVAGVLVVAGGAANPRVKESLFEAVRVALNVEPHRVLVLPGN